MTRMLIVRKDRTGSWRLAWASRETQLRLPFVIRTPITSASSRNESGRCHLASFSLSPGTEENHAVFSLSRSAGARDHL